MMDDYSDIQKFLNEQDRFCRFNGIQLTTVKEDYAEGELVLTEHTRNGLGIAQGGATYTLADFTFAGAANANPERIRYVGSSSHIFYLKPGLGKKITSRAVIVNRTKRTCLADVELFDEDGKQIAKVLCSGLVFHEKTH